ncbi:uncharacterized protein V6R79_004552 [Siganus canaliculatus]
MTSFLPLMVSLALVWLFTPSIASLQSGLDLGGRRTLRQIHCREDTEYQHDSMCCSNCPAGTRLTSPCTAAGRKGSCVECDDGTFTKHSNHLNHCFKCAECRSDEEIVKPCTHTHDTECQCKPGKFCAPDQPCEVCLKCALCGQDEEVVRNCTPTSNTECKKISSKPDSQIAAPIGIISVISVVALLVFAGIIGVCLWKYCKVRETQRNLPDSLKGEESNDDHPADGTSTGESQGLMYTSFFRSRPLVRAKPSVHVEDECAALWKSNNSSASNSQYSLTGLLSAAAAAAEPIAPPAACPVLTDRREDQPELVPENGEESLRKSFEYFENLDIDYHKRFFRILGIDDNVIKSKDNLPYEDRVHELLNIWLEKEGEGASLNVLLKVLLDLNQRRTAETIMTRAVRDGHYHKN